MIFGDVTCTIWNFQLVLNIYAYRFLYFYTYTSFTLLFGQNLALYIYLYISIIMFCTCIQFLCYVYNVMSIILPAFTSDASMIYIYMYSLLSWLALWCFSNLVYTLQKLALIHQVSNLPVQRV
jgi:hypothetical protein